MSNNLSIINTISQEIDLFIKKYIFLSRNKYYAVRKYSIILIL